MASWRTQPKTIGSADRHHGVIDGLQMLIGACNHNNICGPRIVVSTLSQIPLATPWSRWLPLIWARCLSRGIRLSCAADRWPVHDAGERQER
jgi:hypothetical protein